MRPTVGNGLGGIGEDRPNQAIEAKDDEFHESEVDECHRVYLWNNVILLCLIRMAESLGPPLYVYYT